MDAGERSGRLFVVATPLGNLEDVTLRALRVLGEVDVVACEDTRQSAKLLQRHGIRAARLVSLHAHNEASRAERLVESLLGGAQVAVISDAGTPCVSDPGERLVTSCVAAGIEVVAVPGPSAAIAALSVSGLPTGAFRFEGFLPRSQGERRARLEQLGGQPATLILYESPRRVVGLLEDVVTVLGEERRVCVARELTKVHEEVLRGSAAEVLEALRDREAVLGELTVLVEGVAEVERASRAVDAALAQRLAQRLSAEGLSPRSVRGILTEVLGLPRREAYALAEGAKD